MCDNMSHILPKNDPKKVPSLDKKSQKKFFFTPKKHPATRVHHSVVNTAPLVGGLFMFTTGDLQWWWYHHHHRVVINNNP